MEYTKVALLDMMGVTNPVTEIGKFGDDFLKYGPDFLGNLMKSPGHLSPRLESVIRKIGTRDPKALVRGILDKTNSGNLDPDFMVVSGAVNAEGLRVGRFTSNFFPDVPEGLKKLASCGAKVFTYSNGDADVQRLMFANAAMDVTQPRQIVDLTGYIYGYFGTAGDFDGLGNAMKSDPNSFTRIALHLGSQPSDITFASDSIKASQEIR